MRSAFIVPLAFCFVAGFCAAAEEKKAEEPKKEDAQPAAAAAAADGEYQLVDSQALKFRLQGQADYGSDRDDDGIKPVGGKVGTFSCEGQKLELTSEKFEDGFIVTKDYGKIKIRFTTTMLGTVLSVFVTPAQKGRLGMLRK